MPLSVVNVAFPLAPVGPDAVGGAEQIVYHIDRRLVARGHRSIVVACAGSRVAGELVETPVPGGRLDARTHQDAIVHHRRALETVLAHRSVDVVNLHGLDFDQYLPADAVPTLATIHLPPELLTANLIAITRPLTWAHPVSSAQQARLPAATFMLPPIENGVAVDELPRRLTRRGFALVLGRICPEKGIHLALDAAHRARTPVFVGGTVFRYEDHVRYFEHEIVPRLGPDARFLGPLSTVRKRRLLNAARCLLVPSLAQETSSLVAMEALACGTPVIAFATGALPHIVDQGLTGFIVLDAEEMADAIARAHEIDPEVCRHTARARFSAARMADQYIERYEQIIAWARTPAHLTRCESSV